MQLESETSLLCHTEEYHVFLKHVKAYSPFIIVRDSKIIQLTIGDIGSSILLYNSHISQVYLGLHDVQQYM